MTWRLSSTRIRANLDRDPHSPRRRRRGGGATRPRCTRVQPSARNPPPARALARGALGDRSRAGVFRRVRPPLRCGASAARRDGLRAALALRDRVARDRLRGGRARHARRGRHSTPRSATAKHSTTTQQMRTRNGDAASAARPTTGWDSLTPTEVNVVRLVAAGLTNKEVGRELLMGAETVKTHLSHVYDKLGIRSRAALATEFAGAIMTPRGGGRSRRP